VDSFTVGAKNWHDDVLAAALLYLNTYENANISAYDLYDAISSGEDLFIIDWRTQSDFSAERIDISSGGSSVTLVNWSMLELYEHRDELPSDGTKIVNIDYSGQTSSLITATMRIAGYNSTNLVYGMCGWRGGPPWETRTDIGWTDLETSPNDWPTEPQDPPLLTSDQQELRDVVLRLFDEFMETRPAHISPSEVRDLVTDGDATNDPFVINYWSMSDYEVGHIPGAYQITPKAWTADIFETLPADQPIVVYCYTGQTGSQVSSALSILGYEAFNLLYGIYGIDQTHPASHPFAPPDPAFPTVSD
jgi:rhodanese-related sulfurtransferase